MDYGTDVVKKFTNEERKCANMLHFGTNTLEKSANKQRNVMMNEQYFF